MIKYDAIAALWYSCAIDRLVMDGLELSMTKRKKLIECLRTGDGAIPVERQDIEFGNTIVKYCDKFVMDILSSKTSEMTHGALLYTAFKNGDIQHKFIGKIASAPEFYRHSRYLDPIIKKIKYCDEGYLADIGVNIHNLECSIIECRETKYYLGWNVTGIINNKLVSWYSDRVKYEHGMVVNISAVVKDHCNNWNCTSAKETRLKMVKVLYENTN
jgi:hypothetical protein